MTNRVETTQLVDGVPIFASWVAYADTDEIFGFIHDGLLDDELAAESVLSFKIIKGEAIGFSYTDPLGTRGEAFSIAAMREMIRIMLGMNDVNIYENLRNIIKMEMEHHND